MHFLYINLSFSQATATTYSVTSVPTAIIFQDGAEVS